MMHALEPITKRVVNYLEKDEIELIAKTINSKSLVAFYNNTVRFLSDDGSLIVCNSDDFKASAARSLDSSINGNNLFSIYLGDPQKHAWSIIECKNCDEGSGRNSLIELDVKTGRVTTTDIISHREHGGLALEFHLTDQQAASIFKTVSSLAIDTGYKYIPYARNCVGFLDDALKKSGLKGFTSYYTDEELLTNYSAETLGSGAMQYSINTKFTALIHKSFKFAPYNAPNTAAIKSFMITQSKRLSDKVDLAVANENGDIHNIVKEIFASNERAFHSICGKTISAFNLSNDQVTKLSENTIDLTYRDLYYGSVTANYNADMASYYKNTTDTGLLGNIPSCEYLLSLACKNSNEDICSTLFAGNSAHIDEL